jgi:hypothetical protein
VPFQLVQTYIRGVLGFGTGEMHILFLRHRLRSRRCEGALFDNIGSRSASNLPAVSECRVIRAEHRRSESKCQLPGLILSD